MTTSPSPSTSDRAQETAATAADEGKHVAGVAKEEAQNVASEAAGQARMLLDEARTQVGDQSRTQLDRLVETLKTFADDLDQMGEPGAPTPGVATDLARQVSQRVRGLSSHVEGREPSELLDDVRQFARRKPGAFLLGALAAGVVAGRVTRGAKQSSSTSSQFASTTKPGLTGTTNPPMPAATPGYQTVDPVISSDPLGDPGVMGGPASGYGERGTVGGGTHL